MWTRSLLVIFAFLPALYATDSCNLTTCQNGEAIRCINPNEEIPASCSNALIVDLQSIQADIVKKHNQVRNRVAGGTLPAERMGTMRWAPNLARFSQRVVKTCEISNDKCVHTPAYDWAGENSARFVYPKTPNRPNLNVVLEMIDSWIAEQGQTRQNEIKSYPWPLPEGRSIGNFCQMVRNFATRVGCSAMRYEEGNNYVMMLTCLYDLTNHKSWPVYDVGSTASKCKTGVNPNYPNLCSLNESFNVNYFWEEYS